MKHFPGSCVLGEKCLRGRGIGLIVSELAGRSHGVEREAGAGADT